MPLGTAGAVGTKIQRVPAAALKAPLSVGKAVPESHGRSGALILFS